MRAIWRLSNPAASFQSFSIRYSAVAGKILKLVENIACMVSGKIFFKYKASFSRFDWNKSELSNRLNPMIHYSYLLYFFIVNKFLQIQEKERNSSYWNAWSCLSILCYGILLNNYTLSLVKMSKCPVLHVSLFKIHRNIWPRFLSFQFYRPLWSNNDEILQFSLVSGW